MARSWQDSSFEQDEPRAADTPGRFGFPGLTPVVKGLLIANLALFLLSFVLFLARTEAWVWMAEHLGIATAAWRTGSFPVWQLVTWGFLHDVERLGHILTNLLMIYFLGALLEETIGSRRFAWTYFSALLVSGLATLMVGLLSSTDTVTIGASGAALGVVAAAATLRPGVRVVFLIFPITLRALALILFAVDVFQALLQLKGDASGVAHLAHIAGALWGFALVRTGLVWRDPLTALQEGRVRFARARERSDRERVDALLEKISHSGIQSLSSAEREFLKRVSKSP
jgi:membrane associated rhomboid family serine protease